MDKITTAKYQELVLNMAQALRVKGKSDAEIVAALDENDAALMVQASKERRAGLEAAHKRTLDGIAKHQREVASRPGLLEDLGTGFGSVAGSAVEGATGFNLVDKLHPSGAAKRKAFADENPILTGVAKGVGAVASPGNFAARKAAQLAAKGVMSGVKRAGVNAGANAVGGAIDGSLEAAGQGEDILSGAGQGALMSAATGAAADATQGAIRSGRDAKRYLQGKEAGVYDLASMKSTGKGPVGTQNAAEKARDMAFDHDESLPTSLRSDRNELLTGVRGAGEGIEAMSKDTRQEAARRMKQVGDLEGPGLERQSDLDALASQDARFNKALEFIRDAKAREANEFRVSIPTSTKEAAGLVKQNANAIGTRIVDPVAGAMSRNAPRAINVGGEAIDTGAAVLGAGKGKIDEFVRERDRKRAEAVKRGGKKD